MLTLNMLGHVYVTFNGHSVAVSHKGAALLSYLALEGQSHHREHLADLLWDNPQSLRNLRVELTRLKQQGISPFQARQPMLSLNCHTDLTEWTQASPEINESTLPDWLARVRGFPLSGLEDMGSATFRDWVDQQRWRISESLERTLADVYTRLSQQGQNASLKLIRDRAEQLGLQLPQTAATITNPLVAETGVFHYPPQQAQLLEVAHKAQDHYRSQLVLLHGLPGEPRRLINQAFHGTPWRIMQVQVGPQRRLVQAALIQQLARTLPEHRVPLLDLLGNLTEEGELDLIRISAIIVQSATPLTLALHVTECQPWLINAVRFVLDFPYPLVVVLCSTSETVRRDLQAALGDVDWTQQKHLNLSAVGTQGVLRAMEQRAQPCTPFQASCLAQCADGWPLYLQALWDMNPEANRCAPQPESVTHAVLIGLKGLPVDVCTQLSRLAQIQDRFDVTQAAFVLEETDQVRVLHLLRVAREHDLLLPAASREAVQVPGLSIWVNDLETHLTFSSEPVRVALATQLTPLERHQVRLKLSDYYQSRCPALHRHYAARAGLSLPAQGPELAPAALGEVACSSSAQTVSWQILTQEPALTKTARQELRTPNGYRVAQEGSRLEIMRKGRLGPAPRLVLPFGPLPAGYWQLKVRVDILRNFTPDPTPYALAVGHDGQIESAFGIEATYPAGQEVSAVPSQQWLLLDGRSSGGQFELSVQAMDVALTIADLIWNGQSLLSGAVPMQA